LSVEYSRFLSSALSVLGVVGLLINVHDEIEQELEGVGDEVARVDGVVGDIDVPVSELGGRVPLTHQRQSP
jgi:hypothetical protein